MLQATTQIITEIMICAFSILLKKIKHTLIFSLLVLSFISSFCQDKPYGEPVVKPSVILGSIDSFYIYMEKQVRLSDNYTGLDVDGNVMQKDDFLKLLSKGEYLPLRLISKDSMAYYKPFKLKSSDNEMIRLSIKGWAEQVFSQHNMIGKSLPYFNFVDLNGNTYNKENTSGKIVVIKCWFIACPPCIDEIPELNDLIKQYESRKDIIFISLSLDSKKDLKNFLSKTTFNYAAVPGQENYLQNILEIHIYPTHILINKAGKVINIFDDYKKMATALNTEALK